MPLLHADTDHNPNIHLDIPNDQVVHQRILDTFDEINGEGFINRHRRVTLNGAFDMHHTAHTIPAKIRYDLNPVGINPGVNATVYPDGDGFVIRLHSEASLNQYRYLVAHEIAHVAIWLHLLETEYFARDALNRIEKDPDQSKRHEAFCDYFALRMLGYAEIADEIDWDNLPNLHE